MRFLLLLLCMFFTLLGCENNQTKVKTPSIEEKKDVPKFYTNEEVAAENKTLLNKKTAVEFLKEY